MLRNFPLIACTALVMGSVSALADVKVRLSHDYKVGTPCVASDHSWYIAADHDFAQAELKGDSINLTYYTYISRCLNGQITPVSGSASKSAIWVRNTPFKHRIAPKFSADLEDAEDFRSKATVGLSLPALLSAQELADFRAGGTLRKTLYLRVYSVTSGSLWRGKLSKFALDPISHQGQTTVELETDRLSARVLSVRTDVYAD